MISKSDYSLVNFYIMNNDISSFLSYWKNGGDIHFFNEEPLRIAARKGQMEILKIIVEDNADINALDIAGSTALIEATSYSHLEAVQYLINKGANICHNNSFALQRVSVRNQVSLVNLFLEQEVPLIDLETSFLMALSVKNFDVVLAFVEKGVNIDYYLDNSVFDPKIKTSEQLKNRSMVREDMISWYKETLETIHLNKTLESSLSKNNKSSVTTKI